MEQAQDIRRQLLDWFSRFDTAANKRADDKLSDPPTATGRRRNNCSDHPGMLTITFNITVHPVCHACQHRAALALEQKTGFTNIAGHYTMPGDLHAHELENYAQMIRNLSQNNKIPRAEGLDKLHAVWSSLRRLNPELNSITLHRDDLMQVFHAVMGVTSGFNPDDIHEFIHIGGAQMRSSAPDYRARVRKVENALGHIGWVPSLKTLDTIIGQLDKAPPPPKPRRFGF